jgi:hypothetical protein
VGAGAGAGRVTHLRDERFDLALSELLSGTHDGMAGYCRQCPVKGAIDRLRSIRLLQIVRDGPKQLCDIDVLQEHRHGLDRHRVPSEGLELETEPLELILPFLHPHSPGRRQFDGTRHQERLARERPGRCLGAQSLEDDALVCGVLIEEDYSVG